MGRGAYAPRERWRFDREAAWYAMRRTGIGGVAELSAASGVGDEVARKLLSGKTRSPSAGTLCSLAVALGCDALDLMREVGE